MTSGREIKVTPESSIHDGVNKMMATAKLNPYERELLYGYPYLVGQIDGVTIRAPLFTIPISIAADGGTLLVRPEEGRLIADMPEFPLRIDTLKRLSIRSIAR